MSSAYSPPRSHLGIILFHLPLVWAGLVNRTIDDEFGDSVTGEKPTYFPSFSFTQGNCSNCPNPRFDPSQTFRGTWHESGVDDAIRTITVHFTGTAVYVYNTVAVYPTQNSWETSLEFSLDGASVGNFAAAAITPSLTMYRVSVYANDSIPDGEHILEVLVPQHAACHFDYVEYTTSDGATNGVPEGPPSTVHNSSPAAINDSATSDPTPRSGALSGASSTSISTTGTSTTDPLAPSTTTVGIPATTPHLSPAAIAGAAIGVLAAVFAPIILLRAVHRRRARRAPEDRGRSSLLPTPYSMPPAIPHLSEKGAPTPNGIDIANTVTRADAPALTTGAPGVRVASEEEEESATARVQEEQARLRAQVALLQERVERMQEVMELPPEYASDAGREGTGG